MNKANKICKKYGMNPIRFPTDVCIQWDDTGIFFDEFEYYCPLPINNRSDYWPHRMDVEL